MGIFHTYKLAFQNKLLHIIIDICPTRYKDYRTTEKHL